MLFRFLVYSLAQLFGRKLVDQSCIDRCARIYLRTSNYKKQDTKPNIMMNNDDYTTGWQQQWHEKHIIMTRI